MEAVRKDVLASWPAGIKSDNEGRGQWSVRFNSNIWIAQGQQGVMYVQPLPVTNNFDTFFQCYKDDNGSL